MGGVGGRTPPDRERLQDFKEVVEKLLAEAIAPFKEFAFELKVKGASFASSMVKKTYGIDMCKWVDRWTHPSGYIDDLFKAKQAVSTGNQFQTLANGTRNPNAVATSVKELNQVMGLKSTRNSDNERFNWRSFAPAFNTVQLIKLTFLPPSEIDRLLALLGSKEHLSARPARDIKAIKGELNVMHGWHGGLDAGNQWAHGTRLVFARECSVFTRLFMRHVGPHTNLPYEPNNPCETSNTAVYTGARPKAGQGFSIDTAGALEIEAGATRRFDLTGDFKTFTATASSEPGAPIGSIGQRDARGFSFTAPAWKDDLQPIFISAVDDENERTGVLIRITQATVISPAIDTVTMGDRVLFSVTGDRNTTWRVTKGPGHFGNETKLADLQKALAAKRAAKASVAVLEAQLEAEMHTYCAPAKATDGDRVEVEVTLEADGNQPARKLTETFEVVAAEPAK